jgi:hypothetical protein
MKTDLQEERIFETSFGVGNFPAISTCLNSELIFWKIYKQCFFNLFHAKKHTKFITFFGLFICLSISSLNAQFLKDSTSVNLVKKGIDYIYNFQFNNADEVSKELTRLYPGNPAIYLFNGLITYWKSYPLITTSPARTKFEADMRKCIELCDKNKDSSNTVVTLLTNLCARGLLLLYYTDNYLSIEVFPLATSTYQYIRRSFDYTDKYSDFYFFTGLYNYYREVYPNAYPVYKTLAFLFPKGSRIKGLEYLQIVSKSSIILKAESFSFLSGIFLTFENDFHEATYYSKSLHDLYPNNPEYLATYIKNLLLIKQFDEAEKEILTANENLSNPYFQTQVCIFNGILQEKKYHDIKKAEKLYTKGASDITFYGSYGNEYAAYAYYGLSRISDINGDKYYKKIYRKIALKLAYFPKVDFD